MKNIIFNLQLFAAQVQTTLLSGLSPEMKTYYDMDLIDHATPKLVHAQFGQKKPIPQGSGKTIEFRKFSPLAKATTPLVEGVTPNGKSLTVTAFTATVDQYGDFITQSDMLELTALDDTILQATKLLGNQAGLTMDTIVRNKLIGGEQVMFPDKIVDGEAVEVLTRATLDKSAKLNVEVIQRAVAELRAQNAPEIDGKYVGIIHPYAAYDLMRDPEWVDAHKYAQPTELFEGEIGEIADVRFVRTSEAKYWRDNTCPAATGEQLPYLAVFATLILGDDAYGVTEIEGGGLETIVKQKGSGGTEDPLNQRSSVGWKGTMVAERLVENYMVRIESCSKFSTNASTIGGN